MPTAIAPRQATAALTEYWSPRVIGELDDSYLKVDRLLGTFGWHSHDDEDELFLVLAGQLRIELEAGAVELAEGELFVVLRSLSGFGWPVCESTCAVHIPADS